MADDKHVAWAQLVLRLDRGETITRRQVASALDLGDAAARVWWDRLGGVFDDVRRVKVGRAAAWTRGVVRDDRALVDEAVALGFAVDALRPLAGTPWHDALVSLHTSAKARLDGRRHIPDDLSQGFAVVPGGRPVHDTTAILRDLSRAWHDRRRCTIHVIKGTGEEAHRDVDPLGLLLRGDHVLLVAREHVGSKAIKRHYRVDRMRGVHVLPGRFDRPDKRTFDASTHLRDAWGVTLLDDQPPVDVVVEVGGAWPVILGHFNMHPSQRVTPSDRPGWARVTWHVAPCFELEAFLLGLMPDVRVIAPPRLRGRIEGRLTGDARR